MLHAALAGHTPGSTVVSVPRVPSRAGRAAVVPAASVVVRKGEGPADQGGGPGRWLHCPGCQSRTWTPAGKHGSVLLLEAMDVHLAHVGGGVA